jgi:hypothetical protein
MLSMFCLHEMFDKDIDWSSADDKEIHELKLVGTRLTYRDDADGEYAVAFYGPRHHERAKAYYMILATSGDRVHQFRDLDNAQSARQYRPRPKPIRDEEVQSAKPHIGADPPYSKRPH